MSFDPKKISSGDMKNYFQDVMLNSVIVKWSQNFEDEISFKGGRV